MVSQVIRQRERRCLRQKKKAPHLQLSTPPSLLMLGASGNRATVVNFPLARRREILLHYRLRRPTTTSASWIAVSTRTFMGKDCSVLYYRTAPASSVLSDTNFSGRDICSTCSSHLSLSRSYIPAALPALLPVRPSSLEQAARDTKGSSRA